MATWWITPGGGITGEWYTGGVDWSDHMGKDGDGGDVGEVP
ncbi:MAG: hypothetical protein ACK4SY_05440 [Pyrobaculum sp.]